MPRFWARVFQLKKSPGSAYHDQLVRAEELRKRGDAHARMWCEELDRVCEHSRKVLATLTTDLTTLSQQMVTEPALLPSLRRAQQLISTHLHHAWKSDGDGWDYEREKALDADLVNLQDRLVSQLAVSETEWAALRRVCRLERDLFMCRHYLDSQLALLQQQPMTTLQAARWERVEKIQSLWADLQARFARLLYLNTPFKTTVAALPLPEDFTCAICLSVYTDPLTLRQCQHTFCRGCLERYVTTAFATDAPAPPPLLVCPLCRTPFDDSPAAWFSNKELGHFLARYFPKRRSDQASSSSSGSSRSDSPPSVRALPMRRPRPRSAIGAALTHFSQKWHPPFPERRTPSPRPTSFHQDHYDLVRRSWMF